jgi:hypothetical protein
MTEPVDEFDFNFGRNYFLLVLKPIPRSHFDNPHRNFLASHCSIRATSRPGKRNS